MITDNQTISAGLLEQIVTAASSVLEETTREDNDNNHEEFGSGDSSEEVFEDGDEEEEEVGSLRMSDEEDIEEEAEDYEGQSGVAAVLTELSQATSLSSNGNSNSNRDRDRDRDRDRISVNSISNYNNNNNTMQPMPYAPRPNMTATINSISALLQSHLQHPTTSTSTASSTGSQKVRLSGPIRANVNIRHGVWAPRLRCRKRKNLHAKDGIWIHPNCTLEHLIALVRDVLPDEFEWDSQSSPLRYQAVNDQSLQSLKTVSGTVSGGGQHQQSLFAAFDLVRNRRSDGDNFILQLYVYGTWTVLLKPHMISSAASASAGREIEEEDSVPMPPPKKKYQQAHYTQQQQIQLQQQQQLQGSSSEAANNSLFVRHHSQVPSSNNTHLNPPTASVSTPSAFYSHHPLAANPPVTFLPTVTLEMKLNGIFVPVEVSRRSFIAAFRACSIPKQQQVKEDGNAVNAVINTVNNNTVNNNVNNPVNNNLTPPPSDA